jgi:hypothetical protein
MTLHQQSRSPERRAAARRAYEHAQRCAALPPLGKGEAERLVGEYLAKNPPKRCPSPGSFGEGNNLSVGWGGS